MTGIHKELVGEILYVMKYYGSSAVVNERQQEQAERIDEFVRQWAKAEEFLKNNNLDLLELTRSKRDRHYIWLSH